jgi:alkylation response protein AidB-like acyl-CoA dehydrogenase
MSVWGRLAEAGVLGILVPESHGGLGLDELSMVLVMEELGRAAVVGPVMETAAIVAPVLRDAGKATQWLGPIARGEAVATVALEQAPYALDADVADLLVVERDGALLLAPRDAVTLAPQTSVDGARRLFAVEVRGNAEPLGPSAGALDRGALAASAQLLGLARRMIDMTVDYAKTRTQFGSPIGSFQAVKHHLANALVKLELARPVVYRAAYSVAREDADRALHVSMAKAFASDAGALAARVALQCHGAIGYSFEHDLHLFMKRAWALAASFGDAAWHRRRVADAVLGS